MIKEREITAKKLVLCAILLINDLKFDESTVSGGSMENFHKVLEYVRRHIG